jgi:hypothetical protein
MKHVTCMYWITGFIVQVEVPRYLPLFLTAYQAQGITTQNSKLCGKVDNTPASYLGSPQFKSRGGNFILMKVMECYSIWLKTNVSTNIM